jgi:hypothetical protein
VQLLQRVGFLGRRLGAVAVRFRGLVRAIRDNVRRLLRNLLAAKGGATGADLVKRGLGRVENTVESAGNVSADGPHGRTESVFQPRQVNLADHADAGSENAVDEAGRLVEARDRDVQQLLDCGNAEIGSGVEGASDKRRDIKREVGKTLHHCSKGGEDDGDRKFPELADRTECVGEEVSDLAGAEAGLLGEHLKGRFAHVAPGDGRVGELLDLLVGEAKRLDVILHVGVVGRLLLHAEHGEAERARSRSDDAEDRRGGQGGKADPADRGREALRANVAGNKLARQRPDFRTKTADVSRGRGRGLAEVAHGRAGQRRVRGHALDVGRVGRRLCRRALDLRPALHRFLAERIDGLFRPPARCGQLVELRRRRRNLRRIDDKAKGGEVRHFASFGLGANSASHRLSAWRIRSTCQG